MKHILSLGAGVQSSTIALMAKHGEITPMPDAAIFSDTFHEPKAVYDWLDWLEEQLPYPVYRVSNPAGPIIDETLRRRDAQSGNKYIRNIVPAHTLDENGNAGLLIRKCTTDWKVYPIVKKQRELAGLKPRQRAPKKTVLVTSWIGISLDEIQRMKEARESWCENRFPLIEKRMTRGHCLEWMFKNGYPEPPRSACSFCPFHSNEEWRRLKETDQAAWNEAVQFEKDWNEAVKQDTGPSQLRGNLYLHKSKTPLELADLSDPHEDQLTLGFMNECDGLCGT